MMFRNSDIGTLHPPYMMIARMAAIAQKINQPYFDKMVDINYWQKLFSKHTLSFIKQKIDLFIDTYGVDYRFFENGAYATESILEELMMMGVSPINLGSLLDIAVDNASDMTIVQYLLKEKQAKVSTLSLETAISNNRFDCALYLLEQGAAFEQNGRSDENAVLARVCRYGSHKPTNQLRLIKAFIKRGYYLDNEQDLNRHDGVDLVALRQEVLLSHPFLRQAGHQLIDMTQELIHAVTFLFNDTGHTAFYEMEAIKPSVAIDEDKLAIFIDELERKNTPLAYLVAGLLLEGHIENTVLDEDLERKAYTEKRMQDACVFYTKASNNKTLKNVTDILLWQQKIQGPESVITRLKQYDLAPSTEFMPSHVSFARNKVEMPLVYLESKLVDRVDATISARAMAHILSFFPPKAPDHTNEVKKVCRDTRAIEP